MLSHGILYQYVIALEAGKTVNKKIRNEEDLWSCSKVVSSIRPFLLLTLFAMYGSREQKKPFSSAQGLKKHKSSVSLWNATNMAFPLFWLLALFMTRKCRLLLHKSRPRFSTVTVYIFIIAHSCFLFCVHINFSNALKDDSVPYVLHLKDKSVFLVYSWKESLSLEDDKNKLQRRRKTCLIK